VPGDRLAQRLAGDEQETHALFAAWTTTRRRSRIRPATIADRIAHQHVLAADEFLAQRAERREAPAKVAEPWKI